MDRDQPVLGVICVVVFIGISLLAGLNQRPGPDEVAALADRARGGEGKAFQQLLELAPEVDGGTGMQLGIELADLQENRPQEFWSRMLALSPEVRKGVLRVLWGGAFETSRNLNAVLPLKFAPPDKLEVAKQIRFELMQVQVEYGRLVERNLKDQKSGSGK